MITHLVVSLLTRLGLNPDLPEPKDVTINISGWWAVAAVVVVLAACTVLVLVVA